MLQHLEAADFEAGRQHCLCKLPGRLVQGLIRQGESAAVDANALLRLYILQAHAKT